MYVLYISRKSSLSSFLYERNDTELTSNNNNNNNNNNSQSPLCCEVAARKAAR